MHSNRMYTARLLPVSPSMYCSQGVYLPRGMAPPLSVKPAWGCICLEVYLPGGCTCQGGVPARGYLSGGCTCLGCTCPWVPAQEGVLPGGVPARGCTCQGVSVWGVYLPRGVPAWGGEPARGCTCHGRCICPGTPPREQNSLHTPLKILPCPNFVAGGNYEKTRASSNRSKM